MTGVAWPFNETGTSGAPAVTARQLRQMRSPFAAMGTAARPMGAKSGVRVGTPASVVTITGSGPYTWNAGGFSGLIDGEANAAAAAYSHSFEVADTGSIVAAGAAARVDRLDVQISDSDEGDGTSTKSVAVIYTQGAETGGSPANPPARSYRLAYINVPTSGAPTVSFVPEWASAGGEWVFNTYAEMKAYSDTLTAANVPPSLHATVIADTTGSNNGDYVWSGSLWLPVAGLAVPHMRYLKTSSFPWSSPPAIHTWDSAPVEGTVAGVTPSGGVTRFTFTTPGVWRYAGALGNPVGSSNLANIQVRVNGTVAQVFNNPGSGNVTSAWFDWTQRYAAGDYVELWLSGNNQTGVTTDAGSQISHMTLDYLHA